MHYYSHHIGDFRGGCGMFSRLERWLYRDMVEVYYDKEKPLPAGLQEVCDAIGASGPEEEAAVSRVLRIKFTLTEQGYTHERCDAEIAKFHAALLTASKAGKASAAAKAEKRAANDRRVNDRSTPVERRLDDRRTTVEHSLNDRETSVNEPSTNHKPITSNQEPDKVNTNVPPEGETTKVRTKKYHGTAEDVGVAHWILDLMRATFKEMKEPNIDAWADDVRKMREIDGRTHHDICGLFRWAHRDSFWCANIMSPGKLREKWDMLAARRATEGAPNGLPDRFMVNGADHSSTAAAAAASRVKHGITDDSPIDFP